MKAALILMTAAGLGIFLSLAFIGGGGDGCTTPDAIERVIPDCNDSVFQQAPIEVEVATGYRMELALNGTPIPLDQLQTNVGGDSTDSGAAPTVFRFQPGEGKAIEQLQPNMNCATVTYWRIARGEADATDYQWCFRAA